MSKTFGRSPALDSFAVDVARGEIHALLGENGSGKSTLIKILSGYHKPDTGGEVLIDGSPLEFGSASSSFRLGCRFVHQDLGLVASSSVLDNLALNVGFATRWGTIRTKEARRAAHVDLARVGLDVDPDTPVGLLSPVAKTGVAVARALRPSGDVPVKLLVLDEPTATLPEEEVAQLLATIRTVAAQGIAVLYVTHRLDEVFDLAERATVLRDGRVVATQSVSSLDRGSLVALMVGSEFDDARAATAGLPEESGDAMLEVRGLQAGAVNGATFVARAGDLIGIAGITGSGRDSLLSAVFGATPRRAGTVHVDGVALPARSPRRSMAAGIGFLPGDRKTQAGIMDLSARENITLSDLRPFWRRLRLNRRQELAEARDWFDRLDVRPRGGFDEKLSTFSGGNQQKILLAKWLRRKPQVFLLDEPTQGVDVAAKAAIHLQLVAAAAHGAAVIISSSDADELAAVCRQVLIMRAGRVVGSLHGEAVTVRAITQESIDMGARSGV